VLALLQPLPRRSMQSVKRWSHRVDRACNPCSHYANLRNCNHVYTSCCSCTTAPNIVDLLYLTAHWNSWHRELQQPISAQPLPRSVKACSHTRCAGKVTTTVWLSQKQQRAVHCMCETTLTKQRNMTTRS